MQAYISNFDENLNLSEKAESVFNVFFGGTDFKTCFLADSSLLEFRNEHLIMIRDIKKRIDELEGIDTVYFTGGEPLLQRLAVTDIARHAKSKNYRTILKTHLSKPDALKPLLMQDLIDKIIVEMHFVPSDKNIFEQQTSSSTFFKPAEDIIKDVFDSLNILKEFSDKIQIQVNAYYIPGIFEEKKHLLRIAETAKWLDASLNIITSPLENFFRKNSRKKIDEKFPEKKSEEVKEIIESNFPGLLVELQ